MRNGGLFRFYRMPDEPYFEDAELDIELTGLTEELVSGLVIGLVRGLVMELVSGLVTILGTLLITELGR